MSELGNNNIQEEAPKNELCRSCQQFFGNSSQEHLCSKCYREKYNKNTSQTAKKPNEVINTKLDHAEDTLNKDQKMNIEEAKSSDATKEELTDVANTETPARQSDTSRCWKCNKKVGLLGFKCKCDFTYCKVHRLPEEHTCTVDFGRLGKERLARENILVRADKLEKF